MVAGVGSTQLITVGNDDIPVARLLSDLWEGTPSPRTWHERTRTGGRAATGRRPWSWSPARRPTSPPPGTRARPSTASRADVEPLHRPPDRTCADPRGREWLPEAVDDLVERREAHRPEPWCSFSHVRWASSLRPGCPPERKPSVGWPATTRGRGPVSR